MVAVATIGSAVVGAGATAISSSKAAKAQTKAADQANQLQAAQYQQTRSDLLPYRQLGMLGASSLADQYDYLSSATDLPTMPTTMDQATLEKTPGYQFNLSQGLKAAQNSAAARGLGSSGAALKGAATFATGLADSTYQNQFANQQALFGNQQTLYGDTVANKQNTYNMLSGLVTGGENAAAQTGTLGASAASTMGGNTIGAGNAQAASAINTGNAISSGANSIAQYMQSRQFAPSMYSQTTGGLYYG